MDSNAKNKIGLDAINRLYGWCEEEMRAESPSHVPNTLLKQTRELLMLFDSYDVLTCEVKSHLNSRLFQCQSRGCWLADVSDILGVLIGAFSEFATDYDDFGRDTRFFVFETMICDHPTSHGALFRWLRKCFNLRLRAVLKVKEGQYYQAWFDAPRDPYGVADAISARLPVSVYSNFAYINSIAELPSGGGCELIYLDSAEEGGRHE
jgi:hypothetical protein